jgi:hypothetical protein
MASPTDILSKAMLACWYSRYSLARAAFGLSK